MIRKGIMKVKRDLAVILSAAMVLSSFSVPTMAAEYEGAEETVVEDVAEEAAFEEVTEESAEGEVALAEEELAEEEVAAEVEEVEEVLGAAEVKETNVVEATPSSNVTVSFNYLKETYEVSVSSGSVIPKAEVTKATDLAKEAAEDGKKFDKWVSGNSATAFDFANTQVSANLALSANYVALTDKEWHVKYNFNGKTLRTYVSANKTTTSVNTADAAATAEAEKAENLPEHKSFKGWGKTPASVSADAFPLTLISSNRVENVYAVYEDQAQFDVVFTVSGEQIGNVVKVYDGEKVAADKVPAKTAIDAVAAKWGKEFDGTWKKDGTVVVPSEVAITASANFVAQLKDKAPEAAKTYDVTTTVSPDKAGTITVAGLSANKAAAGAKLTYTATAATGYKFKSVTVANKDTGAALKSFTTATGEFTMVSANVVFKALFEKSSSDESVDGLTVIKKADGKQTFAAKDYASKTVSKNATTYFNKYFAFVEDAGKDCKIEANSKLADKDMGIKTQSGKNYFNFKTAGKTKITVKWSGTNTTDERKLDIQRNGVSVTLSGNTSKTNEAITTTEVTTEYGGEFKLGLVTSIIYSFDVEVLDDNGEGDAVEPTYFKGDDAELKTITGKAVVDFDDDIVEGMLQDDEKTLAKYRTLFADGQIALFPKRDQKDDSDIKTTTKIGSTVVSRLNDAGTEMTFKGSTEKHKKVFSAGGGWYLSGSKRVSAALNFKVAEPATVTVYWGSNDATDAYLGLFPASATKDSSVEDNSDTLKVDGDSHAGKTEGIVSTFKIAEAGEYYLGGYKINQQGKNVQIYKVEVKCDSYKEEEKPDTPSQNRPEGAKSDEELAKDYSSLAAAVGNKTANTTLKDVRGMADDTVGFDLGIAKGKVKTVDLAALADGTHGKATINAKVKLGGLSGYTVSTSSNDAKVQKFVAKKAPKAISKNKPVALPAIKGLPVYILTLKNSAKDIEVQLYVVNVNLDKKSIKGLTLTQTAVSANAVSANKADISKTFGAVKNNVATIGTLPADYRFVSGVWTIGKTAIGKVGEPVKVTSGKLTVNAIVNADGTITVAPESGKGGIKFTYNLNGRKYTAAIKVK